MFYLQKAVSIRLTIRLTTVFDVLPLERDQHEAAALQPLHPFGMSEPVLVLGM